MWNTDLSLDLIVETLIDDFERSMKRVEAPAFEKSLQELHRRFPNADTEELMDIISLVCSAYSYSRGDKCELVITAPASFRLKTRRTEDVVSDLIIHAQRSIVITGYSISDYFEGMLDSMIRKSTTGVYVSMYVNDAEKYEEQLQRLKVYRGQYLKLFQYNKSKDDQMAALHAKLIVVDGVTSLVSSANLSYHGMQGNIEMGVLVTSSDKAQMIIEVLKELKRMKIFLPVADQKIN
ncbi:MAG: phospholipase [Lachnospiraceae bacterium]|nr:phospholipase [Lachnospiraceae bacterium]